MNRISKKSRRIKALEIVKMMVAPSHFAFGPDFARNSIGRRVSSSSTCRRRRKELRPWKGLEIVASEEPLLLNIGLGEE